MDDLTNDIGTAIMRLRYAFAKHNIPAPDVLEWSDLDKGMKAAAILRRSTEANHYTVSMEPGVDPYANGFIAGMCCRWKPVKMVYPDRDVCLRDGWELVGVDDGRELRALAGHYAEGTRLVLTEPLPEPDQ